MLRQKTQNVCIPHRVLKNSLYTMLSIKHFVGMRVYMFESELPKTSKIKILIQKKQKSMLFKSCLFRVCDLIIKAYVNC